MSFFSCKHEQVHTFIAFDHFGAQTFFSKFMFKVIVIPRHIVQQYEYFPGIPMTMPLIRVPGQCNSILIFFNMKRSLSAII